MKRSQAGWLNESKADLTERQRYWRHASDEDAQRGNGLAAGFFALLAMPNEAERRERERDKTE